MTLAASFLGGAKSRLLPASIPFRFFAAAAAFHVAMWLALLADAAAALSFRGGIGPALGAIHLLTLGVLACVAIGASVQLLPVATRRALAAVWPIKLVFWSVVPGVAALVVGMHQGHTATLVAASVLVSAGLLLFAGLLADNLRRAGSLPAVAAFGWAALASLLGLVGLGLLLVFDVARGFLPDRAAVGLAHMILGGFGFMGLLALGFSHVLVPMFALAAAPDKKRALAGFLLAASGVALGAAGALAGSRAILTLSALIGLAACGLHLWLMQRALATGMRKRLGLSFVLVRVAWALLPATLLVGLALLYGYAGHNGATLFGFLLVGGWLLTFALGILQRIMPFLASMHAARAGGAPPLVSELATSAPLKIHALCHLLAIALLSAGIAADWLWLARLAGAIGLAGALAFAWFTADVARRVIAPRAG